MRPPHFRQSRRDLLLKRPQDQERPERKWGAQVTSSACVKRVSSTAWKATTPFLICLPYLDLEHPMAAVSRAAELRFSA